MKPQELPPLAKETPCLRWIGALQLFKGLLLVGFAFGLLSFLHKDVDQIVAGWLLASGFDPEGRRLAPMLDALDLVTDRQLFQLSLLAFCFSGIFVTQGTGLLLRQQWAKYLTLAGCLALVPYEVFHMIHRFGLGKLALLLVNIAVAALLFYFLRRERRNEARRDASSLEAERT